jgi:hypothetical protein
MVAKRMLAIPPRIMVIQVASFQGLLLRLDSQIVVRMLRMLAILLPQFFVM